MIAYLYTRVRFNWNEVKYSIYATYELLINIIGMFVTTYRYKYTGEQVTALCVSLSV